MAKELGSVDEFHAAVAALVVNGHDLKTFAQTRWGPWIDKDVDAARVLPPLLMEAWEKEHGMLSHRQGPVWSDILWTNPTINMQETARALVYAGASTFEQEREMVGAKVLEREKVARLTHHLDKWWAAAEGGFGGIALAEALVRNPKIKRKVLAKMKRHFTETGAVGGLTLVNLRRGASDREFTEGLTQLQACSDFDMFAEIVTGTTERSRIKDLMSVARRACQEYGAERVEETLGAFLQKKQVRPSEVEWAVRELEKTKSAKKKWKDAIEWRKEVATANAKGNLEGFL